MLVLLEDILDSIHPEVLEISQKNVGDKGVSYEG
jgi:hypothetical protein